VILLVFFGEFRDVSVTKIFITAGFEHKNGKKCCMNLSSLRLCFQVYVEGSQKGKFNVPLVPVVSNPIYDKST